MDFRTSLFIIVLFRLDIPVKMEPNVTVQMGEVGLLPCKILICQRKVSWLKGVNSTLVTLNPSGGVIDISEPEHEGGLLNMTEDYSLIINDVALQQEGYYFCEVIEFDTGLVYRDLTTLTVYAQPREPYPIIEGCPIECHSNCIITIGSSITLTCRVNEYYPDINQVFMHGSKRLDSLKTQSWNNIDGTKFRNKSITISSDKRKDAYKCIASGIPGLGKKEVSAAVRLIQKLRNLLILTVLFVPTVLCLAVPLLSWMRLHKRGKHLSRKERYMEGHMMYVELWKLVEFVIERHESPRLVDVITLLDGDEESREDMDQEYYYHKLCRWKKKYAKRINQRTTLYEKCRQVNLLEALQNLEDAEGLTPRLPPSVASYPYEYSFGDGVVFSRDSQKALRRESHQDHKYSPESFEKKKRLTTGTHCSPWLAPLPFFIQIVIVMAIILSGSPVLVAGGLSAEQVILQAGQSAVIPFDIPCPPDNISQIFPHYILGFSSKAFPFCINGEDDIKGFKSPSQLTRFTTSVDEKASSICVKLNIDPVDILDEDMYVLQAIFYDFDVRQETVMKEILVRIPPGPAKCFITISESKNYPYEVHCQATTGSSETTLTCFQKGQNGQKVKLVGDLTNNGRVIKGVFLLPDYTYFSCCSHDVNFTVNEKICNDFEWPSNKHSTISPSVIHPSLTQSVPSSVAVIGNSEQASTILLESLVDSNSCKRCMASSPSLTIGIMIYFICVNVMPWDALRSISRCHQ